MELTTLFLNLSKVRMEKIREADKSIKTRENANTAPDGGWGWVIVFAVFTGNCLMDGCIGSYGIFYPEIMRTFKSGPVVTSMAGSLLPAVHMISSPMVGRISMKYGSRPVCFAGGCIGGVGLVLASVSNNIAVFMITFGVILGIGMSMNFLPGHVITNNYFDKKRGIAGGIVCSGAGFGIFILAPVLQLLMEEYGWRGTMLITAGIFMQLCACSTLLRPLCTKNKRHDNSGKDKDEYPRNETDPMISNGPNEVLTLTDIQTKHDDENIVETCADQNETGDKDGKENTCYFKNNRKHSFNRVTLLDRSASLDALTVRQKFIQKDLRISQAITSLQHIPSSKHVSQMEEFLRNSQFSPPDVVLAKSQQLLNDTDTVINFDSISDKCKQRRLRICNPISCDMSMLKNKTFIPLLLGGILIQMGQFIPNMFLPDYCFSIGLNGTQMSIVISMYGVVNIFGRLSAGCLANIRYIDALWLCNLGTFLCGIGCLMFFLCTTFESLCIFSVWLGYFIGYFPPLQILVMVESLGIDKLTSSLGILQMGKGPAALFGPPLAGVVYQYSKNYTMSIGFAGILFALAAVIQSIVPLKNLSCNRKSKQNWGDDIEIVIN